MSGRYIRQGGLIFLVSQLWYKWSMNNQDSICPNSVSHPWGPATMAARLLLSPDAYGWVICWLLTTCFLWLRSLSYQPDKQVTGARWTPSTMRLRGRINFRGVGQRWDYVLKSIFEGRLQRASDNQAGSAIEVWGFGTCLLQSTWWHEGKRLALFCGRRFTNCCLGPTLSACHWMLALALQSTGSCGMIVSATKIPLALNIFFTS